MIRYLDRVVDIGLGCLLVFTPLAFGAVEDWAKAIAQVTIMLVVAAWILGKIWSPAAAPVQLRLSGLEAPALFLVLVVALQLVPLPPSLLRVLSPRTAEIYAQSLPGYGVAEEPTFSDLPRWLAESSDAQEGGAPTMAPPTTDEIRSLPGEIFERAHPAWRTLSMYPAATGRSLQILLAHLLLLVVVYNRVDREARAQRYLRLLAGLAGALSILAIFQHLTSSGELYWWRSSGSGSEPFGPFVSRNNFAGWMELVVPICAGLAATAWQPKRRPSGSLPTGVLLGFVTVFGLAAFLFARSRGGLISLACAAAIYASVVLIRERPQPRKIIALVLTIGAAVALVGWIGGAEVWSRYETLGNVQAEPSFRFRLATTTQTVGMARDFPLFGTGLGTFEQAFVLYTPGTSYKAHKRAHNDYAQLLAETGMLGAVALLWALFVLVRRGLFAGLTRLGWSLRWPIRGVSVGVLALLIHSFVDFNLQIYSNSILFVFLCAVLLRDGSHNLDLKDVQADRMTGRVTRESRTAP